MFDLEDGFVVEGYKVSWLIWVHLLIVVLLVIVLFCGFSIFALDLPNNPACGSASSSSLVNNQSRGKKPLLNCSGSSYGCKVEGNQTIQSEIERSTSKDIAAEDGLEGEQSSAKDLALSRLFGHGHHPCNYLFLAKQAILNCLGLGYSSECYHKSKRGKKD